MCSSSFNSTIYDYSENQCSIVAKRLGIRKSPVQICLVPRTYYVAENRWLSFSLSLYLPIPNMGIVIHANPTGSL